MKTEILNYGDNRTWHATEQLDVETDTDGNVVSVWFRCIALPFKQTTVDEERASEMREMSKRINSEYRLHAVKVEIPKND